MYYSKRVSAGLLSMLFICSLCQSLPSRALAESIPSVVAGSDGAVSTAGASTGSEVSGQAIIKESLALIKALPNPKDTALWAGDLIFSCIIPKSDPNAKVLDKIDEMMLQQNAMKQELSDLKTAVISASYAQQIDNYLTADTGGVVKGYYDTLRRIDNKLKNDGFTDAAKAEAARERTTFLTLTIPNTSTLTSGFCDFDKFTYSLGTLLTMDYLTSSADISQAKLFKLYDEWLKLSVKWEHQGYESRAQFRNYALSQYLTAVSIDKLSLIARIQALPEDSRVALEQRLDQLNSQIDEVAKMASSLQVVKRPDSQRYYQVPGHEMLLYTQAYKPVVRNEDSRARLAPTTFYFGSDPSTHIEGIYGSLVNSSNTYVNYSFWNEFIRYQNIEDKKLTSYDMLRNLYTDYNSNVDLFHILFDSDKGNLIKPDGAQESWVFVVDPDSAHPFKYETNLMSKNILSAYIVNKSCALSYTPIMKYGNYSVDRNNLRSDFIGIGLVSDDNEPAESSFENSEDMLISYGVEPELDENGELPLDGSFMIKNCDPDDFTGAKLNGALIQKNVDYYVEEREDGGISIRLDDDLFDSLNEGNHTLHFYFTNGRAKAEFKKGMSARTASSVPEVPATGGAPGLYTGLAFIVCACLASFILRAAKKKVLIYH